MSKSAFKNELVIIPPLLAYRNSDGSVVLTKKFVEGVDAYVDRWEGSVSVLMMFSPKIDSNLDHISIMPSELRFNLEQHYGEIDNLIERTSTAAIVLGVGEFDLPNQVIVTEYSLKTRFQIINSEKINFFRKFKRSVFQLFEEYKFRRLIRRALGVQCNGTPTFNDYLALNKNSMVYFDNRILSSDLISVKRLKARTKLIKSNRKLRIAFSGRLISMKGAQYIPEIAVSLKRKNIPFTFSVFGDGDLYGYLQSEILRLELDDCLILKGNVDFRDVLLQELSDNIDLFVCPHVQGDPSCTYIETLACGVPIVGFRNEAWLGMQELSGAGVATPMHDVEGLVAAINALYQDFERVKVMSTLARDFASLNLFGKVMDDRVDHLKRLATFC